MRTISGARFALVSAKRGVVVCDLRPRNQATVLSCPNGNILFCRILERSKGSRSGQNNRPAVSAPSPGVMSFLPTPALLEMC